MVASLKKFAVTRKNIVTAFICITGMYASAAKPTMPDLESDWHQQRLLLFVLERQRRNREFLFAERRPLHIELERHQQLGGRQGLADRLSAGP